MNRLVIIGNGFDLAHGLKTSYADFITWYMKDLITSLEETNKVIYEKDPLCSVKVKSEMWTISNLLKGHCYDDIGGLERNDYLKITKSSFLESILLDYKQKGWIDIEEIYYSLLKKCVINDYSIQTKIKKVRELNAQLDFLKIKLIEYLSTIILDEMRESFNKIIHSKIDIEYEIENSAAESIKLQMGNRTKGTPNRILLLSFNYTSIAEQYCRGLEKCLYIHGKLDNLESVVFGYGDELDDDYKNIAKCNENEYLKHFKSYKYLERSVYKDVLRFIESDKFQIMILGHSCGNSDRTLLNTLFNHKNCISIKPYYYINDKGEDNYSDLIMNISRSFNDTADMRSKVVDKEHCEALK